MTDTPELIAAEIDRLLGKLVPEIPKGMEIQIYANEDGYNAVLLSEQGGQDDHWTLAELWKTARGYRVDEDSH